MLTAIAALSLLLAAGAERQVLAIEPGASPVRFQLNHKLHQVNGVSRGAEGKAILEPDGQVRTMVRIPVQSFDSGDANRDSHMLEALQAGRHPFVIFKGVGALPHRPAGSPAELQLRGELEFHGVRRPVEVPVTVELGADGSARVRGRLPVSLEAHGLERPSLLTVKVDDDCAIDFDLRLGRDR
jgi:polyisoprenoid-binding protein YceI